MKTTRTWMILLFVALLLVVPAASGLAQTGESAPRVLFLNSYHPGFPTYHQQLEGITSAFGGQGIVLDVEFMDTKRFDTPENLERFTGLLHYKLTHAHPYDVVITSDDNALVFALEHQDDLFLNIPIVFLGVNDLDRAVAMNQNPLVTGVVEAVSMRETIELMLRLTPDITTITALVDGTLSGQGDLATFYRLAGDFPAVVFDDLSLADLTFDEFSAALAALDEGTAVLLLSAYHDSAGMTLDFDESLALIVEYLDRPLYHLWYHGMGDGVLGGKLISHVEQGQVAAELALRILDGESPADIPVDTESPNRFVFDYRQLQRFRIPTSALPTDTLLVNESALVQLYNAYRPLIWGVGLVIVLLAAFSGGLAFNILIRRRVEIRLRESEAFSRAISNNPANLIYVYDLTVPGNIWVSDSHRKLLTGPAGEDLSTARHDTIIGVIHPDDIHLIDETMVWLKGNTDQSWRETEYRVFGADRRWHWLRDRVSVFKRDEQGHVVQILGSAIDITERKQAEEQMRFQAEVLAAVQEAVIATGMDGRITYWNRYAELLYGWRSEEALGQQVVELMSAADSVEHGHEVMESLRRGESWSGQFRVKRKDGSEFLAMVMDSPLVDQAGELTGIIGLSFDITERNRAEQIIKARLRVSEMALSHSLEELLRVMLDEVEALTESEAGFCHFVSPDGNTILLQTWSTNTVENLCQLGDADRHYPLEQAGIWADAVRYQQPVIHNDYASAEGRTGLPEGHIAIGRQLVVPVFRESGVKMVVGVGNKPQDYTEQDVQTLQTLSNMIWDIVEYRMTHDALEESEERFRRAIVDAPLPAMLYQEDGQVLALNNAWVEISGYARSEIQTVDDWIQRAYGDRYQEPVTKALEDLYTRQSRFNQGEFTIRTRDGQDRIWDFSVSPLGAGPDGKRIMLSMATDITRRKQSEQQVSRLLQQQIAVNQLSLAMGEALTLPEVYQKACEHVRTLVDAYVFIVSSFDQETDLLHAEHIAVDGVSVDCSAMPPIPLEPPGQGIQSRVIHSGSPLCIDDLVQFMAQTNTYYHFEEDGTLHEDPLEPDETEQEVKSAVCAPMKVEGRTTGVMQVQSLRRYAYAQEDVDLLAAVANVVAVSVQNARLHDEVRQHAQQLEKTVATRTARLQEVNEELNEFAYVVSHDLKAPLRAITQLAGWITTDYGSEMDDEGREMLQLLIGRTRRMHELIEGILQYSRIGRVKEREKVLDLNRLVADVIDTLAPPENVTLTVAAGLPSVIGEETRIHQVFQNLLGNAIQYVGCPDGQISVTYEDRDTCWAFMIADNGPGIDPQYHGKIFQIFQTLAPRDEVESTGIGLALVKRIVEAHQGEVWVESSPGQGSTFGFTLPKPAERDIDA